MEWQQIIGFAHVVKLGSFTRAAEATCRTQSALSQQVRALETELGCQLLERIGKRKLLLTDHGERFYRFTRNILDQYDRCVEDLGELDGLQKGHLTIAAPFTTLYHLLPPVIRGYSKEFPDVQLTVLDRPQQSVVDLVRNGDVDLGLAQESMVPHDLRGIRWKEVETVLMVPKGHPLSGKKRASLKQIAKFPLILPPSSQSHGIRAELEDRLRNSGEEYHVVMESSNADLSSMYVEMGLGVSFASIVRDLPALKERNLDFIPLGHYFKPDYVSAVMRKDRNLPLYRSTFVNLMLERDSSSEGQ
jgi:DNA-binding transcriptional LysR family regulator